MKRTLFSLILSALIASTLNAIVVERLQNPKLFGIQVERDAQEYYGRADSVNSVSMQSYITATYRVKEMVIDIHGSPLQLRIYHAAMLDPREEAKRLKSKTGVQQFNIPTIGTPQPVQKALDGVNRVNNAVLLKEYPVTTHAKTIEFRVEELEELERFYTLFRNNWLRVETEEEEVLETVKTNGSKQETLTTTEKLSPQINGRLFILQGTDFSQ